MSQFHYSAVDQTGRKIIGQLSAATRSEALQALARDALMPLSLQERQGGTRSGVRVRSSAIAAACSLLADQLDTGVPLLKALRVMEQQTASTGLKTALAAIAERVTDGTSLAQAMSEQDSLFGELDVSLVRAGEEGGFLDESLRRLAAVRERQEEIRGRLVSALAYPALLVMVGSLVVGGMLTFFVPKFEPLFESLRQANRMPWPTTVLLNISSFLQVWCLPLLLLLAVAVFVARWCLSADSVRLLRDRACLQLRGIGPVVRNLAIARFCRVLGTLLQNGVPMLKSLEIAGQATGNRVLRDTIADAATSIGAGHNLSLPLEASGHFPPDVLEMLSVAEHSSKLDSVLIRLADKLEQRSQQKLDILMKLFEPALMLVMAIVVGFLVIALLMPVFEGNGLT
jgi:general secretion pathway protein F